MDVRIVCSVAGARGEYRDLQADLGEVEGIEIVLSAVEIAADGVVVSLRARQNARTDELDAVYQAALGEWEPMAVAAGHRGERPLAPPAQPGALLNAIALGLKDDLGTPYRRRSSQAAGTGTEWDAVWRFDPTPPTRATRLVVAIDGASGAYRLLL
jgi:hypothetical protein